MKNLAFALTMAAAFAASGCFDFERKTTVAGPSGTGVDALVGTWSSTNIIPSPSGCTNFKWNVTEQTSNRAEGSFSATCAGDLKVSGVAEGELSGSSIRWSASGTAAAPGLPSCAITLHGTAEIGIDSIRVPYSGDTCLGKVSGVEILQRH